VILNVNSLSALFDVKLILPENFRGITPGNDLDTQVSLIPLVRNAEFEIVLNYFVRDFEGRVYYTESEDIKIKGEKTFDKKYYTKNVPPGSYVAVLELVHGSKKVVASKQFEVREGILRSGLPWYLWAILIITFTALVLIFKVLHKNMNPKLKKPLKTKKRKTVKNKEPVKKIVRQRDEKKQVINKQVINKQINKNFKDYKKMFK